MITPKDDNNSKHRHHCLFVFYKKNPMITPKDDNNNVHCHCLLVFFSYKRSRKKWQYEGLTVIVFFFFLLCSKRRWQWQCSSSSSCSSSYCVPKEDDDDKLTIVFFFFFLVLVWTWCIMHPSSNNCHRKQNPSKKKNRKTKVWAVPGNCPDRQTDRHCKFNI
jgi:hypothetical protein